MRIYLSGFIIGLLIAVQITLTLATLELTEKVQHLEGLHHAKD